MSEVRLNPSVDPRDAEALRGKQEDILAVLRFKPRTALELSYVALSYRQRISELCQAGYDIRAERVSGRNYLYTLIGEPGKAVHETDAPAADHDGASGCAPGAADLGTGESEAGDDAAGEGACESAGCGQTVRSHGPTVHDEVDEGQSRPSASSTGGSGLGPVTDATLESQEDFSTGSESLASYERFIQSKFRAVAPTGFDAIVDAGYLFPFQRDLVRWAVKRGRAAIFAATGLGKTRMELEYARLVSGQTGGRVLVLAPLAVAPQTVREGASIGVDVTLCREPGDVRDGINITNYDRLHKFDASKFVGVVLDESSCIKHWEAKTLAHLCDAFAETPFKLCASATPAPNDFAELGTHAEFLNVRSRAEMLAEFFVHDGSSSANTGGWRLKGHARRAFWEWVASWAALVRLPSDLGYNDDGYILPPLDVRHHILPADLSETLATGVLFPELARGLAAQRSAKRASLGRRVAAVVDLVRGDSEQWMCWCELNSEQDALADALGDDCVSIYGSLDADEKERRWDLFRTGQRRVLVSKVSIFGYGINAQFVNRMAFVGASNSYEDWHQAVRRIWRFGQTRPVQVHVVLGEAERAILENLKRKEADAARMADELSVATRAAVSANVLGRIARFNPYAAPSPTWPDWLR